MLLVMSALPVMNKGQFLSVSTRSVHAVIIVSILGRMTNVAGAVKYLGRSA